MSTNIRPSATRLPLARPLAAVITALALLTLCAPRSFGQAAPPARRYRLTKIAVPGAQKTEVGGINNRGQVTGYHRDATSQKDVSFIWSNGNLTKLPPDPYEFKARDITDSGLVYSESRLWNGTAYSTIGAHIVKYNNRGEGIRRWVTHDLLFHFSEYIKPNYQFDGYGGYRLKPLPGHRDGRWPSNIAYDMNDHGVIVGTSNIMSGIPPDHRYLGDAPVFWSPTGDAKEPYTEAKPYGPEITFPLRINNKGQVLGHKITPEGYKDWHTYYLLDGGSWQALPFAPTEARPYTLHLNDLGHVIVNGGAFPNESIFLWENGVTLNLTNIVREGGLNLHWCQDFNNAGQILVRATHVQTSESGYYLLTPGSAAPKMSISPQSLGFGRVAREPFKDGKYQGFHEKKLTIKNTGDAGTVLTGNVAAATGPFTVVAGGGAFSLQKDQTREVTIRFKSQTPTPKGTANGTLPISSNASSQVVQLSADLYYDKKSPDKPKFGGFFYYRDSPSSIWIEIHEPWEIANMRKVPILPIPGAGPSLPQTLYCNKAAFPRFQAALAMIRAKNLGSLIKTWDGIFAERYQKPRSANKLSLHCWGVAVDINEDTNPQEANSVPSAENQQLWDEVFSKVGGFVWGDTFPGDRRDPMHYEIQ